MASCRQKFLLLSFLSVGVAAALASAQPAVSPEFPPALLRQPWSRGSMLFERHWQFLGPLATAEATADPAALLRPDSAAAQRWQAAVGWTDAVEVAVPHTSADAPAAGAGVFALGRVKVHREAAGAATLLLGADGGLELFVNGASVFRRAKPQPFSFDQDAVTVALKPGDNDVVVRLEHHEGPWRVALRTVEPGAISPPREEITPVLNDTDPKVLSIRTHRERAVSLGLVTIEIVAPGGAVVARGSGTRGDVLPFMTAAWADGPYEVCCSTETAWGQPRYAYLPWYKGDAGAAARELVAAAAQEPAGPAGDTVRMLADLVRDRLHGKLESAGPESWRDIHSPLFEYAELKLNRAGKPGSDRPSGFVRLAYTDEVDGSTQYCRAYLPAGYDPAKRWPLVAFLHGYNPPNPPYINWWSVDDRHRDEADNSGVILIEPHGRGNAMYQGIGEKDVLRAIDEAKRRFSVDDDRVYLTGESMGGHGTWWIATRHPDVFAAAAPVYGGWDARIPGGPFSGPGTVNPTTDLQQWMAEKASSFASAENLLNLPLAVHHGDIDPTVPVAESRFARHLLERWGYDIAYHEHVGWGHEDLLYRGRIVDWLLTHRRNNAPKAVRLRAADLGAASAYWLKVETWDRPGRLMEVDAEFLRPGLLRLDSQNVAAVTLTPPDALARLGSELTVIWNGRPRTVTLLPRPSVYLEAIDLPVGTLKHRGQEGSIPDVVTTPFIVVTGTISPDARMRELCRQKAEQFAANWNQWQRQRPRLRNDTELTTEEKKTYSLVLIGGPADNAVAKDLAPSLPLGVDAAGVTIDGRNWPAPDAVVQLICPHPLAPERYVVVVAGTSATGLYFWNPAWAGGAGTMIPWDWTIRDGRRVALPPGSPAEDALVAAGIFDRSWHRDDQATVRGNDVLRAASPLRHGPLEAEAAAKVSFQAFVGEYEIYPGFAVRAFEQDGSGWIQFPGQPAQRLLPESDTEFGLAGTGECCRFEIGADRQVTGLTFNQAGTETTCKRRPAQP